MYERKTENLVDGFQEDIARFDSLCNGTRLCPSLSQLGLQVLDKALNLAKASGLNQDQIQDCLDNHILEKSSRDDVELHAGQTVAAVTSLLSQQGINLTGALALTHEYNWTNLDAIRGLRSGLWPVEDLRPKPTLTLVGGDTSQGGAA